MSETDKIVDQIMKLTQIEAITNTYTEMLKKHPEQKELLDAMLKLKLEALK